MKLNYEKEFIDYPDVVDMKQFAKMADIGETLAGKITRAGHVRSIYHVTKGWQYPKKWVIEYLQSPHYLELKDYLDRRRGK